MSGQDVKDGKVKYLGKGYSLYYNLEKNKRLDLDDLAEEYGDFKLSEELMCNSENPNERVIRTF
jgi:hypothetical protein